MNKNYDEAYASSFIKGLTTLTGVPERKLKRYASENNLFNVLEHPGTIEPNEQQLEKINLLNEFLSTYKLLKMQEHETKIYLNSSMKAGEYFASMLGEVKNKEKFLASFLDSSNNIIETRTISEGTIGEAVVYPRDVLKAALDCDCKETPNACWYRKCSWYCRNVGCFRKKYAEYRISHKDSMGVEQYYSL